MAKIDPSMDEPLYNFTPTEWLSMGIHPMATNNHPWRMEKSG